MIINSIKIILYKLKRLNFKKDINTLLKIIKFLLISLLRKLRIVIIGVLFGKYINPDMVRVAMVEYLFDTHKKNKVVKILPQFKKIKELIAVDIVKRKIIIELLVLEKKLLSSEFNQSNYLLLENLKYFTFMKIGFYQEILPKINIILYRLRNNYFKKNILEFSEHQGVINLSRGWGGSIGHLGHFARILKAKKLGLLSRDSYKIFVPTSNVICHVDNWNFLYYLTKAALKIPGIELDYSNKKYLFDLLFPTAIQMDIWDFKSQPKDLYRALTEVDTSWSASNFLPFLELENKHIQRGQIILREMGISNDDWFIAIHVRNNLSPLSISQSARNADIDTYIPAINKIIQLGGHVILMGDKESKRLPFNINKCYDYAHSNLKSEWMDVFLWSQCRFFVGTLSGPLEIPPLFGIPTLLTNAPCFGSEGSVTRSKTIMMPKLHFCYQRKRYLTFSEVLDLPIGWCENLNMIEDVIIEDNSSEDLISALYEMYELTQPIKNFEEEVNKKIKNNYIMIKLSRIREKYNTFGNPPMPLTFLYKYQHLVN